MKSLNFLFVATIITSLTACSSAPEKGSFAERLMSRGDQAKGIAKQWDEGQGLVNKGEKMKVDGQKTIDDGKAKITKGERMIEDGDAMIAKGKQMMSDSEGAYQNMRATPIPLPATQP